MKKILFSTDIGSDIDDALALLIMLNKGIDLRGIYSINGDVDSRCFISKRMVDLAGRKIPVAKGESESFSGKTPYFFFENYLIDDCFIDKEETNFSCNITFKKIEDCGIIKNGIEHLVSLLQEKHIIFNVAPLTNIARLLVDYPDCVKNIEEIYVMGCRFNGALEHNIFFDLTAARIVFDSDIPLFVVPGDLCEKYRMPVEFLEKLKSNAGLYVKKMADSFLGAKTAIELMSKKTDIGYLKESLNQLEPVLNDPEKNNDFYQKKHYLTVNLFDMYEGALAGFDGDYFKQISKLVTLLRNTEANFQNGDFYAGLIESCLPKKLSVADVFIPYCFLHPEKLKTINGKINVGEQGRCSILEGDKHTIVTDIDFAHFEQFVKDNLY